MTEKFQIQQHIKDYVKLTFNIEPTKKNDLFDCPFCNNKTANIYDKSHKLKCLTPECGFNGDIYDIVQKKFPSFNTEEKISEYLKNKLKIKIVDHIGDLLTRYEDAGFFMFPIGDDKRPKEGFKWLQDSVCNKKVWKSWVDRGYGLAILCGKQSNVVALDIDDEKAFKQVEHLIPDTLTQTTTRGNHFLFEYEECYDHIKHKNLRNSKDASKNFDGEIRCNNAYVVVAPTSVEGEVRSWNDSKIIKMPDNLKEFIMSRVKNTELSLDEKIQECIDNEKIDTVDLTGNRNTTFIKLAGILRKFLNIKDTFRVLSIISNNLIDKPIPKNELYAIMGQVKAYNTYDQEELAKDILSFLEMKKEASDYVIAQTLKLEQLDVTTVLSYLEEQKKVIKTSNNTFKKLEDVEWKTDFESMSVPVNFEVPYFHDYAHFDHQNMVMIGGKTGTGKTYIVANILKKLVDQGISPYLITTEAGSKIYKPLKKLGYDQNSRMIKHTTVKHVNNIQLPKNSICVVDWVKPEEGNFAKTDMTFEKLQQQMIDRNCFLFVMVQIRSTTGEFFAKDLIHHYSALSCTYNYGQNGNEEDNVNTYFQTDKIRDSKHGHQYIKIPTHFNKDTAELKLKGSK